MLDRFLDARDCEGVNNVRVLHLHYLVVGPLYLRISRATVCVYFICIIWSLVIKESDSSNYIDSTSSCTFAKTFGCESRRVMAQRSDEVEASRASKRKSKR